MKKSLTGYSFRLLLGVFVALMLACGSVLAQGQGLSAIRGTIKDPQGSVVAGANVTLTNAETNVPRTTTSNEDRKSTRLNSSHLVISYAVFCLKKKRNTPHRHS